MKSSTANLRKKTLTTPAPGLHASFLHTGHLERLLTDIGLWQHTHHSDPNPRHGYSIDDEARGLIVGLRYWQGDAETELYARLAATCFDFVRRAAITDGPMAGHYHNFCDAEGRWLDPIGSDDSFGRTFWSLGVAHAVDAPFARDAANLLYRSLPAVDDLHAGYLRAKAFVVLGLAECRLDDGRLRRLADDLLDAYARTSGDGWHWFEDQMTYENARLPQALLAAAAVFPDDPRCAEIGADALDFLLQVSRNGKGGYAPVGNAPMEKDGWFKRGQARPPLFDQQPVDAGALVEACVQAYRVTREPRFRKAAYGAFGWYMGDNHHGLPVYNHETGGVADALTRAGVSRNQGAESILSVHLAFQALESLE